MSHLLIAYKMLSNILLSFSSQADELTGYH